MNRYFLVILIACSAFFASCSQYGKKVTINDYTEVYIKGDGVTEADARKLGDYIATTYKEQTNHKSFQLTKEAGQFVVRMVVDEQRLKDDPSLDASFMALQFLFESQVFTGNKVTLILTDNTFKDIKTFPSTDRDRKAGN